MASNKLFLNISKTTSIVFGTNHSLSSRSQMNLVMNGAAVEQVEEIKMTWYYLRLLWSKHIDSMVVKMRRGLSVIKRCSTFLTPRSKMQVLKALVLSYLNYCPVMWSSVVNKDLVKLQLAQNRAARLSLHCKQKADMNTMHASLSWLRVKERLTASNLAFIRNNVLEIPNCLHSQLTHSTDTHTLTPPDMPPGVFSQSPGPEKK